MYESALKRFEQNDNVQDALWNLISGHKLVNGDGELTWNNVEAAIHDSLNYNQEDREGQRDIERDASYVKKDFDIFDGQRINDGRSHGYSIYSEDKTRMDGIITEKEFKKNCFLNPLFCDRVYKNYLEYLKLETD